MMRIGSGIENRGHVIGFQEEIAKAADRSDDAFFTWFDGAANADAAFVRGSWDFALHFALPAAPYLSAPETQTALEIGHGGGRILAAASRCFGTVVGVDVHNNNEKVEARLRAEGVGNARLLQGDGQSLPLPDGSVDFAYSFIVLQHVERFATFVSYWRETYRALRPGGLAILYFGRAAHFSLNRSARWRYRCDRLVERLRLPRGYREVAAPVNCTNLLVSLPCAVQLARATGFEVLDRVVSHKQVPDGFTRYGGQHGLILRKR
jgi:SAM-dependent methyltransferase